MKAYFNSISEFYEIVEVKEFKYANVYFCGYTGYELRLNGVLLDVFIGYNEAVEFLNSFKELKGNNFNEDFSNWK